MALEQPQENWADGGPFLAAVCAGMGVSELLHSPSFSLFESTTAIEIGDPKMDIGLHRSQETGSVEELICGGGAPLALPPPLLLALLDRLLCLEATWHTGSMLPQTVFASLYMLQPDRWVGGRVRLPGAGCGRRDASAQDWGWLSCSTATASAGSYPPRTLPCCMPTGWQARRQCGAACLLPGASVRLHHICRHGTCGGGHRGGCRTVWCGRPGAVSSRKHCAAGSACSAVLC